MDTYKLLANQTRRHPTQVSVEALAPSLASLVEGAVVRSVVARHLGYFEIDVRLDGQDHAEAVDALATALLRLGVSVVSAEVSEWATVETQGAIIGLLAGTALGSFGQVIGALIGAGVGTIVGTAVGGTQVRVVNCYDASRSRPWGQWQITPHRPDEGEAGRSPATS